MTKEQLEALIKSENVWALRSTLVLALGILGEYVVLPLFEKREKKPPWTKLVKVVFALLVVGGIGGEYEFSSKIANNALQLQTLADSELQSATRQAGDAKLKAAELEAQIADRHITLEQRKKMLDILKVRRGTPIAIGYLTDSGSDSQEYASELAEVFCDAKWNVSRPLRLVSYDVPLHGFLFDVQGKTSPKRGPSTASQTPKPPSKRLVGSVKKALAITGYKTLVNVPPFGYSIGGDAPSCKNPAPSASNPPWYPTALEILVGSK